jgi:hypothetical protein
MNKKVLLEITLTLASTTFSVPAFSQAMAESVLLGAGSSTATVSAGSALNSSLNRSSKQLAGRVQQQVSRPQQAKTPPSVKHLLPNAQNRGTADRRAPQSGDLTVSVKGAEPNCAVRGNETSGGQGTGAGQTPHTNCISPNASGKPEPTKYKSVVTVTFPN